jgi:ribonuclease VapC
MFVDASAIVALVSREPDHESLAARLDEAGAGATSAIAIYEATTAIVRKSELSVGRALALIGEFLRRAGIEVLPIDEEAGRLALVAFERYGKGRGHPAKLNLGDCFAYAMAKQHGVALLYKGDDFLLTDLA